MSAPAVISGSLVDAKNVHTHKSLRLIIDVPAEHAAKVFEAFGWPTMANPVSVAIARLTDHAGSSNGRTAGFDPADAGSTPAPAAKSSPASDRKPVALASKVAMAIERIEFFDFLADQDAYDDLRAQVMDDLAPQGGAITAQAIAEEMVKRLCGVTRKRDIVPGTPAGERWADIWFQFRHWQSERAA